jgi:hypothetical protein
MDGRIPEARPRINRSVTRRHITTLLLLLPAALRGAERTAVRGRLKAGDGERYMLETAAKGLVRLDGDIATKAVLRDPRVVREDEFEALGEWKSKELFQIDPIHVKALFIRRGGKLLVITYWCEVCAIRTYAPGRCACCQEETAFDPRDPSLENTAPTA